MRIFRRDDPMLLDIIQEYLVQNGIYKTRLKHLRDHIQSKLPLHIKAPAFSTLSQILREVFHQQFKKEDLACVRYRDSIYNQKRLWISRIVAQLMSDNVVILSVDESNIRSDALREKQWQFNPNLSNPKRVNRKDVIRDVKRRLNEYNIDQRLVGANTHTDYQRALTHEKRTVKVRQKKSHAWKKTLIAATGQIILNKRPLIRREKPLQYESNGFVQPLDVPPPKKPRGRPRKVRVQEEEEKVPL